MNEYSIADNFNQYFKVKFANSKVLRQEAFKIRYNVYSQELGWEPTNQLAMETDEYDDYSYHCLLEHRRTGTFAGCVRLVIPPPLTPNLLLPFEKNCLHTAHHQVVDTTIPNRGSFAEISRLAVLSSFRRREKEKNTPFVLQAIDPTTVYSEEERRNFPNIAMGLYLAAVSLADICQHSAMFVMMEPRLNRRLKRFGLPFLQVGDEMNYHGQRAMFYLAKKDFSASLTHELKRLYDIIHSDLLQQINLIPFTNPLDK